MVISTHRSAKNVPELPKEEVKAPIVQLPIVEKQEKVVKKVEKAISPTHSGLVPEADEEDSDK